MRLEMICTGEEVLSGQILDTNAPWFSDTMMSHGLELQRRITIGDRMDDLVSTFLERSLVADVVLVNGGLGPTSDDLSAEALARALNEPLVEDGDWRAHLEEWFHIRGRQMPASNLKQCLLPASAILIDNPHGSAPGFRAKLNDCWFFFTPGPPSEFKPMVEEQFLPFLKQTFSLNTPTRLHKLLTLGHGESSLADTLSRLTVPAGISLGYRSSMPHVEIKLFARGEAAIAALDEVIVKVRQLLGQAIVAENKPTIAREVHDLMISGRHTLGLAESCTGGMLSSQLVDFAGSSAYLLQGLVTYSNSAKEKLLGVPGATLQEFGAVSMETAEAMARGALSSAGADYALAVTGVAGPDGGSEEKPVGMVCIALAAKDGVWIQSVQLSRRSRNLVRSMSCAIALDMLRRHLLDTAPIVNYPFVSRTSDRHLT